MYVGIYARVSTKDQTVDNQISKLKDYAGLRGWVVVDVYSDHAVSGKKKSRPDLDRLRSDVRSGRVNGVLIWKLDRLGRSLMDLIDIANYLRVHNCSLISFENNVDTTTSEGRLMFHLIGAFAEFEAALISERTQLAYERKQSLAKNLGKKPVWGRKNLKFSDVELRLIECWRSHGMSLRRIADKVNLVRDAFNVGRSKSEKLSHVSHETIRKVSNNGYGGFDGCGSSRS
jgi:DNA invertase Pin-like site-specific DNA recombinase